MPVETAPEVIEQYKTYAICSFTGHRFSETQDQDIIDTFMPFGVIRIKECTYVGETMTDCRVFNHVVSGQAFYDEMLYVPTGDRTITEELSERLYAVCVAAGAIPADAVPV